MLVTLCANTWIRDWKAISEEPGEKEKRRKGEIREESFPSLWNFSGKHLWLKNNHHRLEEHLVIMLCSMGQSIFLVLQYLLPLRPWRWNLHSSVWSVPINLHQQTIRIHIHICLHSTNWWTKWAFDKVILKLFICVCFLSNWKEKIRKDLNHIQIRA